MAAERKPPRLFGTNGVRGVVGSKEMDCQFAVRLGLAIGTYMQGTMMIGTDARTSSDMLKSACASGLMASGCRVLDCGVVPTPTLQYAVKTYREKAAGGVVITASHNPPEFNGIKCIYSDGTETSREQEESIEAIYHSGEFARADWTRIGSIAPFTAAIERYIGGILSKIDVMAIRRANLRIALDCGNGAGALVTPKLLDRLAVRYVTLNADPNGAFPGHGSEPTPENTEDLTKLVRSGGFDMGVVHDGDADRSIFVDENGRYLYGDRSLAIVAKYVCSLRPGRTVVTTVGSSMAVEDAVKLEGGKVIYTSVGSPVVARVMMREGGAFGGEENGGLIFPEFQYCRDGAFALAKMLEIVSNLGKLSRLNDAIPQYSQFKTKVSCPESKKAQVMTGMLRTAKSEKIDTTDGIKIYYDDGWVLVRPSGTEPIVRIFTESRTPERAKDLADSSKKLVERFVKG